MFQLLVYDHRCNTDDEVCLLVQGLNFLGWLSWCHIHAAVVHPLIWGGSTTESLYFMLWYFIWKISNDDPYDSKVEWDQEFHLGGKHDWIEPFCCCIIKYSIEMGICKFEQLLSCKKLPYAPAKSGKFKKIFCFSGKWRKKIHKVKKSTFFESLMLWHYW